jgi:hypothetical protein
LYVSNFHGPKKTGSQVADRIRQFRIHLAQTNVDNALREKVPKVGSSLRRRDFRELVSVVNRPPPPALPTELGSKLRIGVEEAQSFLVWLSLALLTACCDGFALRWRAF